jgi:hypothetical protein
VSPPAPAQRLRIVVAGLMGGLPLAGLTAHYLQYVLGLRDLGHDVLYLEDTEWYYDPWSKTYCDAWTRATMPAAARPPTFLDRVMSACGLGDRWTWTDISGERFGLTGPSFERFLGSADLFVHVTGAGILRDEYLRIPRRAYVDTDPGYVQMRTAGSRADVEVAHLGHHTVHFSFGGNLGDPDCAIPDLGLVWHPTLQPVHLDLWPPALLPRRGAPLTTVIKWKPYDSVEYLGREYGMKDSEFVRFVNLAARAPVPIELASEGDPPVPRAELRQAGWRLRDALEISRGLDDYRAYIHGSLGEWSVAKNAYVETRSGWFSDRSATYLASGRPVLLQSTGWERRLPTGEGLFAFETEDDVLAALEVIERDPERHRRAARELAEAHFDARTVLAELVETAMAAAAGEGSAVRLPAASAGSG